MKRSLPAAARLPQALAADAATPAGLRCLTRPPAAVPGDARRRAEEQTASGSDQGTPGRPREEARRSGQRDISTLHANGHFYPVATTTAIQRDVNRPVEAPMLSIAQETVYQDAVQYLLRAADEMSATLYPAASRHGLDADTLASFGVRFFVARLDGQAVGCGGFTPASRTEGELKRMFVEAALRGHGIGWSLLRAIESAARTEGIHVMRLETGVQSTEAIKLYRRSGYRERGHSENTAWTRLASSWKKFYAFRGPGSSTRFSKWTRPNGASVGLDGPFSDIHCHCRHARNPCRTGGDQ